MGKNISISEDTEHFFVYPVGYFVKYHFIGGTMGINTLYFAVCRHYGIVRASASTIFDMGTFAACCVHVLLKLMHALPGIGLGKVCHGRVVINIAHNIFGHAYKTIAWVYVSFRADCKGISHAVNISADSASACEYTFAQMVNIHDFNPAQVFQVFIQKVN